MSSSKELLYKKCSEIFGVLEEDPFIQEQYYLIMDKILVAIALEPFR